MKNPNKKRQRSQQYRQAVVQAIINEHVVNLAEEVKFKKLVRSGVIRREALG